jgi:hypothetical protein
MFKGADDPARNLIWPVNCLVLRGIMFRETARYDVFTYILREAPPRWLNTDKAWHRALMVKCQMSGQYLKLDRERLFPHPFLFTLH